MTAGNIMRKKQIDTQAFFLLLRSFPKNNGSGIVPDNLSLTPGQVIRSDQDTIGIQNNLASLQPVTEDNPWFLIGASVTGNGHKVSGIPCQDSHKVDVWGKGWGVAVVSDGAGSAEKSHYASSFVVEECAKQALSLVRLRKWMDTESLPDAEEWNKEAKLLMLRIQEALKSYAKKLNCGLTDLHTTLIMVIFSPTGLLMVHVGDGRAGYMDKETNLKSMMVPFEGEQVGETVFLTMDFEKHPEMVETRVINEAVKAFFLLSDGCERVCWETLQKDENSNYYKPNRPFVPFYTQTITAFESLHCVEQDETLMKIWYDYLDKGHQGFQIETDDKTMVIGMLIESNIK